MANRSVSVNIGPFGFLPVMVFIVFLTLKLGGWGVVATWSWLWVTCPLWIGLGLVLACFVIFIVFALIVGLLKAIFG